MKLNYRKNIDFINHKIRFSQKFNSENGNNDIGNKPAKFIC